MTADIINYINTRLRGSISYLMGNVYGVARKGQIKDGNRTKTFPVTRNYTQKNCNKDCEITLTPKRDNKALLFWLESRVIDSEQLTEFTRRINATAKMFVWVNTEKLTTEEVTADMVAGEIMRNVPRFINQAGRTFGVHLLRQTYQFSDNDFKQFDWDRAFTACPYIYFTIDFEFEYYMRSECNDPVETMNLNECNLPQS